MQSLTVAYITSRLEPKLEWFLDSLTAQWPQYDIIIIDGIRKVRGLSTSKQIGAGHYSPKPTIWQGEHRITKEDWWAKSNALNTAICLCKTDWIAFVDDRSILMPGWIDCIRDAMNANYAVCGTYEKHSGVRCVDGKFIMSDAILGVDHRPRSSGMFPARVFPTKDWYGGHGALPLEWCLAVNGFSEDLCDGLGSEDSMFGCTLHNAGFEIRYDPRMMIIEDRTPGEIDGALKRADKGVSPLDKSHAIVTALSNAKTSGNSFDIRNLRDRVLSGEPFPPPSASHFDWYDGKPISEME